MLESIHHPNAFPTSSNQPGAKEAHFWVVSSFEETVPAPLTCLSEMLPPSDNTSRVKQSCVTIYIKYRAASIPSLPSWGKQYSKESIFWLEERNPATSFIIISEEKLFPPCLRKILNHWPKKRNPEDVVDDFLSDTACPGLWPLEYPTLGGWLITRVTLTAEAGLPPPMESSRATPYPLLHINAFQVPECPTQLTHINETMRTISFSLV